MNLKKYEIILVENLYNKFQYIIILLLLLFFSCIHQQKNNTCRNVSYVHETRSILRSNYVLFSMHTLMCKKFNELFKICLYTISAVT